MKVLKIHYVLGLLLMCFALPAFSQDSCSDADQLALDTCNSDAEAVCQAQFPNCTGTTISLDDALALLDGKCDCDSSKNFGKYNSCLKKVRNGIRATGALTDEIKAAFADKRSACKADKKASKKGKKGGGDDDDDDDDDDVT